jgi:hypothetical protein
VKLHYDEGVTTHIGPEPCIAGREARGEASAGGSHRPAIEPRYEYPGCRRCRDRGRQHGQARQRECLDNPAGSENLACADALCLETGRSHVRPMAQLPARSASGRRGAVADDVRAWEVRLRHSSYEADEQRGATRRGAGGAKLLDAEGLFLAGAHPTATTGTSCWTGRPRGRRPRELEAQFSISARKRGLLGPCCSFQRKNSRYSAACSDSLRGGLVRCPV